MVSAARTKGARIYVEGAEREDLRRVARPAFLRLFSSTLGQRTPSFVFCGSRLDAYREFVEHLKSGRTEDALLLVDAEDVVTAATRWEHLKKRKGDEWSRPARARETDVRFMSVVMETWCIAESFPSRQLERIPKEEVFATLKRSGWTKEGANSFLLVAKANAQLLAERSPEFRALCARLHALSS